MAVASIAPRRVDAGVAFSTWLTGCQTLVYINASGAFFVQMIASPTVWHIFLASVRTIRIDTRLSNWTRCNGAQTFININAVAQRILNKANLALLLGPATEGSWGILTDKIGEAVMSTSLTLVNIFAKIVLSQFITSTATGLALAAERSKRIDADLSKSTIVGCSDTLVNIFTSKTIWLKLVAHEAGTENTGTRIPALLGTGTTSSTAVVQILVLMVSLSW